MLTYLALSPHPPMIIPAIGKDRLKDVKDTVAALEKMAQNLVAANPDTVVFLTPHGNVFRDCITALGMPDLYGDLKNFGVRDIVFKYKNDPGLLKEISLNAVKNDIDFILVDEDTTRSHRLNPHLDHGILVPLYYLREAGLRNDTAILAISIGGISRLSLYTLGKIIRDAADKLGKNIALVASGDMSHRLKDDGPYGFNPDGPKFDLFIREHLEKGDVEAILNVPESLCENAGECGYRSIVIMLGSMDGYEIKSEVYAYEGPFGVGYLTAGFTLGNKKPSYLEKMRQQKREEIQERREKESLPVKWARMVLESYVRDGVKPDLPPEMEELKTKRGAVFVSLKKDGDLRGCIGTIQPVHANLAEEIANNAISAGLHDPRFLPVEERELEDLVYSVDILSSPEECTKKDLDPNEYGVIVSKGSRRGLLLPALEGVDTVEQQLSIALQKARIAPHEDYKIERFKVERYY